MNNSKSVLSVLFVFIAGFGLLAAKKSAPETAYDQGVRKFARDTFNEGKKIFRYDTFGDEAFWGGALKLHQAIQGEKHGGVGAGVSPRTALAVGLKVDMDALPPAVAEAIKSGKADLEDPSTTLELLKLDAVVGVKGIFDDKKKNLKSMGITCALCHSTVDDSFAPGIGHRLDGWANRDLDVGTIVSLAPDLSAVEGLLQTDRETVLKVVKSWGPGKFDASLFIDGKAFRPDGKTAATLIPPAYGLLGSNTHTFEGWGSVTYWNAFVANLEMHGQGTFVDPRLNDKARFSVASRTGQGNVRPGYADMITPKLAALQLYQLSIPAPKAPAGSFDKAAAERGEAIFAGSKARCATCHVPPLFTEPGYNMHTPEEIGIDSFQADRGPDGRYRTTPLKGLHAHQKGGFYHDGRFGTLGEVVEHYDRFQKSGLTNREKSDLVEYLKSL